MSPLVIPAGVKVQGNLSVKWVPTIANPAAPLLTEVNAGTAKEIADFLFSWVPGINQNKGTAPRRIGSTIQNEQFGSTTYSLGDLQYMFDPQGAAAAAKMKAYEALTPGLSGYFVERGGIDASTAYATGQFVAVWPVTLGNRQPSGDTTDEFAEFNVNQAVIVNASRTERVALT